MNHESMQVAVKDLLVKLGVPEETEGLTLHGLRATGANLLFEATGSVDVVAAAGHWTAMHWLRI